MTPSIGPRHPSAAVSFGTVELTIALTPGCSPRLPKNVGTLWSASP